MSPTKIVPPTSKRATRTVETSWSRFERLISGVSGCSRGMRGWEDILHLETASSLSSVKKRVYAEWTKLLEVWALIIRI